MVLTEQKKKTKAYHALEIVFEHKLSCPQDETYFYGIQFGAWLGVLWILTPLKFEISKIWHGNLLPESGSNENLGRKKCEYFETLVDQLYTRRQDASMILAIKFYTCDEW